MTEELQVTKRMYQCCLETEQILKKEKQKAIEDVWAVKASSSDEIENLLKIQVCLYVYKFMFNHKINVHLFTYKWYHLTFRLYL